MGKFATVFLLACATTGIIYAQAMKTAAPAKPSVVDSIKQLEHDWTDGAMAKDTDKVGSVLADDWTALEPDGTIETRQKALDGLKSGQMVLTSFDFGPMTVKVIGGTAIVQGSDTEKSVTKGKDSSGKYVWMDMFMLRNGKWQAVRSVTGIMK